MRFNALFIVVEVQAELKISVSDTDSASETRFLAIIVSDEIPLNR